MHQDVREFPPIGNPASNSDTLPKMGSPRTWPAPWLFSLLILPLAIYIGFVQTALPYLLDKAGAPVDRIATLASIINLPGILLFIWAPLVDIKLRRRTWLVLSACTAALFFCAAMPVIGTAHQALMAVLLIIPGVAISLVLCSCGGLLVRAVAPAAQSKAAAWKEAGFLGGSALGGGLLLWLAVRTPLLFVGFIAAAIIALPSLVALTIDEPPPPASPWFRGRLAVIGREVRGVIGSRERLWSALLLLSPLGTGAAAELLPALASRYGVGGTGVMWINGIGGGFALALGSLCGALIPAGWDRRLTYAMAGLSNGLAATVLLTAHRPSVYFAGTTLYLATSGFCLARCTALIAEIVGQDTRDASTLFSALWASNAIPFTYLTWLEGFGFKKLGTRGLLWTDAAANFSIFAIVVVVFVAYGMRLRRVPASEVSPSDLPAT